MKNLKKKSVKINRYTIGLVKEFMDAYGMMHYTASGEADPVCAQLVKKRYAWACLSEDMDQFVYGTTRILRYFNLATETMCVYNFKKILSELKIPQEDFKDICILSGTDYNLSNTTTLFKSLKLYTRFKRSKKQLTFYEWLIRNTNYIEDINLLHHTKNIFDTKTNLIDIQKQDIKMVEPKWGMVKNIMKPYGYIILDK
jgi:5'-3' exonuclease